jgi:hypothetical protein
MKLVLVFFAVVAVRGGAVRVSRIGASRVDRLGGAYLGDLGGSFGDARLPTVTPRSWIMAEKRVNC